MTEAVVHQCSFCGAEGAANTPLIAGIDGHICESCVSLARQGETAHGTCDVSGEGVQQALLKLVEGAQAALVRILTEPRNALVRQYQQLFGFEGVRLELTPEALTAIARKAIERGTGARGLRSVLEALLKRTMFDMPSDPVVTVCRVSEGAVVGESDIELEYGGEREDDSERSVG